MSFTEFASQQADTQRFSELLADYAGDHWQRAINHRFTEELGDDKLSAEVYGHYLVQDYAFIETLVNLVARAIAAAPAMPQKAVLAGFLAALTSDENTYFLRSFEALGLTEAEYLNPPLNPASQGIIDELNDAALTGYEDAITVLCCAEWCYLSWARAQAHKNPSRFYLSEWIELHVLPEFESFVNWLREEVDRFADADAATQARIAERFLLISRLEHEFFDEAYK